MAFSTSQSQQQSEYSGHLQVPDMWDLASSGDGAGLATLHRLGVDLAAQDADGLTLAHRAALNGHAIVIDQLHKLGIPLNMRTVEGFEPLHCAALAGHVPVIDMLRKCGADLRTTADLRQALIDPGNTEPDDGMATKMTALHLAAVAGHPNVVRTLCDIGLGPNELDGGGATPLHWAAAAGHDGVVEVLCEVGANMSARFLNMRPIDMAVASGHARVITAMRLLGDKLLSASEERFGRAGNTLVHLAARSGRPEMIRILHADGARLQARNFAGRTPLHLAAGATPGHPDVIKALAHLDKEVDLNALDSNCDTAAHIAARVGNDGVVWILGNLGANLNLRNLSGRTPTHLAAENGHAKVIRVLANAGADLTAPDSLWLSPMHRAAQQGRRESILALREAGVDPTSRNCAGASPRDFAMLYGHHSIVPELAAQPQSRFPLPVGRSRMV